MTTTTWASRESWSGVPGPTKATGLLQMPSTGDIAAPLAVDELPAAVDLSARSLTGAGLHPSDRVVVALNSDGIGVGAHVAQAAAHAAEAAVNAGPRGRMRLLRALEGSGATALVVTPTGAMDLLARLHIEFLVDPLDLGIERVVLVGEIPSPGCERQLAMEFGAEVGSVLCDPFFGVAVGHREGDRLAADPAHVVAAPLADDVETAPEAGPYELVLRPTWSGPLGDTRLRTGWVGTATADTAGAVPWPTATVGDRVLVRGHWLSVRAVAGALRLIDGIEAWSLELRRDGTLDKVQLRVAFNRPSLTQNRMWAGRLNASISALTPIDVEVEVVDDPAAIGDRVVDHRGHHLGIDRTAVKAP